MALQVQDAAAIDGPEFRLFDGKAELLLDRTPPSGQVKDLGDVQMTTPKPE